MKKGIIILGHGSRSGGADDTVKQVAAEVRKFSGSDIVEYAFLEYAVPTLQDAWEKCVRQKAEQIVLVPFFMQAGAHVTRDIPAFVETARKQHPEITIIVTEYVGAHPLMSKIVLDLIEKNK